MKLIIGLGNPTKEYQSTRHNIGFDAITRLCDDYHIRLDAKEHKALCGKGHIGGERALLAKPQTFMNSSGESVRALADYYKIASGDIIIIYDDIHLPVGQLRIRPKGSAGGHNGIKSIIAHLGTEEFPRIRIGVGEKPEEWELINYVLGHFTKEEDAIMKEALARAAQACECMIANGIAEAMNLYNGKLP